MKRLSRLRLEICSLCIKEAELLLCGVSRSLPVGTSSSRNDFSSTHRCPLGISIAPLVNGYVVDSRSLGWKWFVSTLSKTRVITD